MTSAVAPITALLLGVSFLLMGSGLQGALLPVRATLENFSSLDVGILGSAYYLGFALGCFYGPQVVRHVGHIRTFTGMVAIASSVVLVHALLLTPWIWWTLRAATGFCFAVLYLVIESWLNEKSTNENRGLVFSIYTIITLTVITLGQMMLVLDRPQNFLLFAIASILVSLAAVPVALARAEAPAPIKSVKVRLKHLFELSPIGVVGCFAVGLVNGAFWSLAPVFALGDQAGPSGVAFFMSVAVIAGAVGQWPIGRASDRMDRRIVIIIACLGGALAGIGLGFLPQVWDRATLVLVFAFGIFAFPIYSLAVAHMNDFVEPDGYVEASGGLLLVFAAGAVVGPLIASVIMRTWGSHTLFLYTACAHAGMAAYAFYRTRRRQPLPQEERVAFADSVRIAQTVSTVDPLPSDQVEASSEDREPTPIGDPQGADEEESPPGSSGRSPQ